jgi:hypothetical protein
VRASDKHGRSVDLRDHCLGTIRVAGVGSCYGPSSYRRGSDELQGYAKRHYTLEEISKTPWMLEPFEIDFLRQDLKAVLAFSGGLEPIASDPRCFTYARQVGLPFLYGVSTPEGARLLPAHRRRRLVQVTCTY